MYENGVSAILGDEMGLGKTIQVLNDLLRTLTHLLHTLTHLLHTLNHLLHTLNCCVHSIAAYTHSLSKFSPCSFFVYVCLCICICICVGHSLFPAFYILVALTLLPQCMLCVELRTDLCARYGTVDCFLGPPPVYTGSIWASSSGGPTVCAVDVGLRVQASVS